MSDRRDAAVIVVVGLVLIGSGGYLYESNQQATANAEQVEATVLESRMYDADPGDDPHDDANDDYRAEVEYRYEYDGETYTSANLCPGAGEGCAPGGNDRSEAEEFVADYPEGETVTAYVPADSPGDAYLVEGGSPMVYLGLAGAGGLVVLLGLRKLVG